MTERTTHLKSAPGDDLMAACPHCTGDRPAALVVIKKVTMTVYEHHAAGCPTLTEMVR